MVSNSVSKLPFTGALIKSAVDTGNDWHYNACVGRNTGSSENSVGYSGGFEKATEVLLASLGIAPPPAAGDRWGRDRLVDMLVYPICYCARHHVELALKRVLPKAWTAFKIRSPNDAKGLSEPTNNIDHSVMLFWKQINDICGKTDARLGTLSAALEPYIHDIELIDSSGQVFRYAADARTAELHLGEVNHIDLIHFAAGYAKMSRILEDLEYALIDVTCELETGSFTTRLARDQLMEIASILPPFSEWKSEEFKKKRDGIRKDYGLSSNDFQRALNYIKSTRALAFRVGIDLPIEHLDKDVFEHLHRVGPGDKNAARLLSEDQRSALHAVLEVASHFVYPEKFESFLIQRPEDEDAAARYDLARDASYLARKYSQLPDLIEMSLASLGQTKLLEDFRRIYSDHIDHLKKSREAHRFEDFSDYLDRPGDS